MAGMGRGLLVGAALGMVALTSAANAETIPLPTPAPLPKEGAAASTRPTAAQGGGSGLATGFKSLFHLDREPEAPPTSTSTTAGFNSAQRAQVDKVSAYLSSIQQLVGDFVQVGPDGSRVRGEFYIQKPGRVRFDYEPPSRIQIIADGQSVVVRARKLATQVLYPLSQTPLRFLLSERIDLLKDTNLVGVYSDNMFASIVIEERQVFGGTHRLMLMFGAKDFELTQWTVTDPQGY